MKIKITQLDFRKDPDFDRNGLVGDYHAKPSVVQYKLHWWCGWHYIMDEEMRQPKLFYGSHTEIIQYLKKGGCRV